MADGKYEISPTVTLIVLTIFTLLFLLIYFNHKRFFATDDNRVNVISGFAPPVEIGQEGDEDEKSKKLTVKQRKRQEAKEEAKRLKALKEEERQEKEKLIKKKQEIYEAKRAEREKIRQEEEEKRRLEEEKAYQELTASFKVESEGFNEVGKDFDLNDFIQFIIDKKLSNIEELSARFNIKPKEIIKRIEELESQNKIFGLLDDQGRYIYISDEEVNSIIKFINKKGKVHKYQDLVPSFNSIISLESKKELTNITLED